MSKNYNVLIIGGGPSGLYSSIVLKRGIPTSSIVENISVGIIEQGIFGGLTKYGHITISKRWSFSGSNLISAFHTEAKDLGVDLKDKERVISIFNHPDKVEVITSKDSYLSDYVIIATGLISNPDLLKDENKYTIALHTPTHMMDEINEKKAKKILIYGPNLKSLEILKNELLDAGAELVKTKTCLLDNSEINKKDITDEEYNFYDLIMLDYNSYKVCNESIPRINIPGLQTINNFCVTNEFGKTNLNRIYATGTAANIISGVLMALTSALITSLKVGRTINKHTLADPSGRFPWFPRETSWDDSWLLYFEKSGLKLNCNSNNNKY